ncbi:lasso peptide biosynthesis B2 protein [Synechococcus sp. PCC 6312]|uniref:lasso peptide biosynthesis B2 protein n=1 Tax=Synechococcus sp. (strain ATCC 27167 / PCC 6312) TaxID=195253 RepID=UPI00029F185C|nr:lasso peptide biosynthesis B2 protein [Synechococcus sp. PCC 6312]AFY60308.1 hypothetical protein Syn6312_1118 [Synechococcus sp. PCC 6312]
MLKPFKTWFNLSPSHRLLVVQAGVLVLGFRLGLWFLPFARLRRFPDFLSQRLHKSVPLQSIPLKKLIWSIKITARRIPKATCLTQALAAQTLLQTYGYEARLCVGVMLDEQKKLAAHAWITHQQAVVIGQLPNLDCFKPLL